MFVSSKLIGTKQHQISIQKNFYEDGKFRANENVI